MSAESVCKTVSQRISSKPDLLDLHASNPARYPFLLESAAHGIDPDGAASAQARYDILFAFPGETLNSLGNGVLSGSYSDGAISFLDALDQWAKAERVANPGSVLPFSGGWFLYFAYELAGELEPGLRLPLSASQPIAIATRIPAAIIYDRLTGEHWAIAEASHAQLLDQLVDDAAVVSAQAADTQGTVLPESAELFVHEAPAEDFIAAVNSAKRHISAGDIYQANLSRQWHAKGSGKPAWQLYQQLRAANPAPYAGLAVFGKEQGLPGDFAVISSSPERLVCVHDGRVETRPIAGTRPRINDAPISRAELDEFLGHPKERAEHVMLIDLERNDLGRICIGGSVEVNEFMAVESYSHVHHIVSNVIGDLRPGTTFGQVIRAVFPGGTITGCPKVRCMEIIAELEGCPRGAYTGSMGYLNRDGSCDLNILIRTMVLQDDDITLSAGSGIVADSDPESELNETRAKAKGLLLAIR